MEIQNLSTVDSDAIQWPYILPENFKVYTDGNIVLNWNPGGFEEVVLPTYNDYKGKDGGYGRDLYSGSRGGPL